MSSAKVPAVSPFVLCEKGNLKTVSKQMQSLIFQQNLTRVFVPLTPVAIRNARSGKISENEGIARLQKLCQIAFENKLRVVSMYDKSIALKGQKKLNRKIGPKRTEFDLRYDKALTKYDGKGNKEMNLLFGEKFYFDKLAAIDIGLKKIKKNNPSKESLILTKQFFAPFVLEKLRIPSSNYFGINPYGKIPEKSVELKLAMNYLLERKRLINKKSNFKTHKPNPNIKRPLNTQPTKNRNRVYKMRRKI
jgi:hypothetical protein